MTGNDHHHRGKAEHAPAHHAARPHAATHSHHSNSQHPHHAKSSAGRRRWSGLRRGLVRFLRRPIWRKLFWGLTITLASATVAVLALWWRLSSGPIELDVATPFLKAAIEDNFGGSQTVSVGGTQIERDEKGRTSLRLRDIVVRDADGTVVASAPKAEVGLSGMSLISGKVRAQSLNLVGAEMSVRIESDGRVTVFAGADKRPIATAAPVIAPARAPPSSSTSAPSASVTPPPLQAGFADIASLMAWLDGVGASGLDGHDLGELGLKDGNLIVDDRRNGKRWTFDHINASLTRPEQGGVIFRIESENSDRPWVLSAAMRPLADGVRAIGIEARKVSTRDMLLALRMNEVSIDVNLPVSASIRADIAPDGTPQVVQGELYTDAGSIVDHNNESSRIEIERADFRFNWDARRRSLLVPFQIHAGGNQITMRAVLEPPAEADGPWRLSMTRGDAVIDPVIIGAGADGESFALNRAVVRARVDFARRRIDVDQGDFSRIDTRPSHNIAVAVTGSLDLSGEPHLAFGVAGTRMPTSTMKRMWPVFAAADVREWVESHISGGIVERVVIAGNAALADFKAGGPPTPEDGLSVDIETSGTTLRPVDTLPAIRDADLNVRITGGTATINIGRGTVEVAPGRKLGIAGGVFEVPDTHPKPAPARATFRIDGSAPAAAAFLSSEAMRDEVGLALDPAGSRGTVSAQVTVNLALSKQMPKNSTTYAIAAELTNFAADNLLLGQKVEASSLKVNASSGGYQIKGDVKINGTAATIDLRKKRDDPAAELNMKANIDEAARRRLGIDFGGTVTGSIPVKVTGQVGENIKDDRMSVEADLTPVKIDNLLPGWVKPAGKAAHATYTLVKTGKQMRFDDLSIEGAGATVKGAIELDANGALQSAHFPVFKLSDGDKVSLKADRGGDGILRVIMRGDVYDGRGFVKSALAGAPDVNKAKEKERQSDLDLDVKLGTVVGHNGETLRGLELRLSRRSGHIRTFTMSSKIGRDTPLNGDMRLRARDNHQVIFFETADAGALFRFTDTYPRMHGGNMWVAMDPPTQEQAPQVGTIAIRDFAIRGEPALDRIASGAPGSIGRGVNFSEMSAEFTRFPGRMSVRDGVVRGPVVGATIEGQIDYVKNDVHLRGTFVPFYGLNNMFGLGQIPIVGLFLGGTNEGLLGITYEAVGPPGSPRISVNPVSAIAPGLLRKFIPSPGQFDSGFTPQR
ncbi:MAG TPA: DUF3971 domain-containing protein [Pseudolabrys sp.]|nr:DUF3971 domain-containing protein [Pseudolabrys sp.]